MFNLEHLKIFILAWDILVTIFRLRKIYKFRWILSVTYVYKVFCRYQSGFQLLTCAKHDPRIKNCVPRQDFAKNRGKKPILTTITVNHDMDIKLLPVFKQIIKDFKKKSHYKLRMKIQKIYELLSRRKPYINRHLILSRRMISRHNNKLQNYFCV